MARAIPLAMQADQHLVLRRERRTSARPAVFLDRDGVVNVERNYVHRIEDFEFMPHALETCRQLASAGYALVVITNQAGLARGFYSQTQFLQLCDWMAARFEEAYAPLDGIYFCPHHPDGAVPALCGTCACRKPAPGMILAAAQDLGLDLARSALVGDKMSDIVAGRRAGVGRCVLMQSVGQSSGNLHDVYADSSDAADVQVAGWRAAGQYLLATLQA